VIKSPALAGVRSLAQAAATELDTKHGDPSRNASWIRERQLALYLIALLDCVEAVGEPMEKKR
jgi:hypothetical protein